jgi:predicted DNA-binding protein (UPF0251 family)
MYFKDRVVCLQHDTANCLSVHQSIMQSVCVKTILNKLWSALVDGTKIHEHAGNLKNVLLQA